MKDKDIDVVTRVRKNTKEVPHCEFRCCSIKRSLVETVFDELKNLCQLSIPGTVHYRTSPSTSWRASWRTAFLRSSLALQYGTRETPGRELTPFDIQNSG